MSKRPYVQKKRAESRDETHARIVEATMRLHEELGPRAATISAIAERAGVQRLTVYRHFTDESELFQACTSRWLGEHPPPDPAQWQDEPNPRRRVTSGLGALYAYYRATQRMWTVSHRDEADVPGLQAPMAAFHAYTERLADGLLAGWRGAARVRRQRAATLRHAVRFATWTSLAREGLSDGEAAALVLRWLDGID
ncbi:MAG: TetR/AcrR family transcriptional regulator [Pseudomonadota bacterium]|nr:TetR/AcrR family transcriptional regulator [Pseudomonadota bacterium]